MCLSTDKLKFLDKTKYLVPWFSYNKYLKAYGCEVMKDHFPYEYMDCLRKLDDTALPPREAYYRQLKNEGISEEGDNGKTTMCDLLVCYLFGTTKETWCLSYKLLTNSSFSTSD